MKQDRYHINFKDRRTTITVDRVISELLAIKMGMLPDDLGTHSKLRTWFEDLLHDKLGESAPGGTHISQDARQYAIEYLVSKKLMDKVWDWRIARDDAG